MDKIKQNRHGGGGGREVKSYLLVLLNFRFFYLLIYFIYFSNFTVGWNYGNLTFLFILFIFLFFKFVSFSSSSCAGSSKFPDPLDILPCYPSLLAGLLECILRPHKADVSPCWSTNIDTSMCRSPLGNVTYVFILASPAVSRKSCSSCFGWFLCLMAYQPL